MIRCLLAALAALSIFSTAAEARRFDGSGSGAVTRFCGDRVCGWVQPGFWGGSNRHAAPRPKTSHRTRHKIDATPRNLAAGSIRRHGADIRPRIVGHPHGCPPVAFCGCGVARYLGIRDRSLFLAANWLRFPRAEAGPGMVAARPGHVFVILRVIGRGMVLAWDPNSGGHLTRVHARPLAGFSVRNPKAGRLAALR